MSTLDIFLSSSKFLYFTLLLLSAGGVLFSFIFGHLLKDSHQRLNEFLKTITIFSVVYVIIFLFVDAIKFMGSFDGFLDFEIQKMIFQSHLGVSKLMALLGLVVLAIALKLKQNSQLIVGMVGITLVAVSFTYTGHSAENPFRFILSPLLILHILVVAFWFGSLIPLYIIVKHEDPAVSGGIVESYSKKATFIVPLIFIAGLIIGLILMKGVNFFDHTYGLIVLFKIGLFSALMLIAALNKWRLGPQLLSNNPGASKNLRIALTVEFLFICTIVLATAILTGYFSPEFG
jgi:putative copper resistance protein D